MFAILDKYLSLPNAKLFLYAIISISILIFMLLPYPAATIKTEIIETEKIVMRTVDTSKKQKVNKSTTTITEKPTGEKVTVIQNDIVENETNKKVIDLKVDKSVTTSIVEVKLPNYKYGLGVVYYKSFPYYNTLQQPKLEDFSLILSYKPIERLSGIFFLSGDKKIGLGLQLNF